MFRDIRACFQLKIFTTFQDAMNQMIRYIMAIDNWSDPSFGNDATDADSESDLSSNPVRRTLAFSATPTSSSSRYETIRLTGTRASKFPAKKEPFCFC